MSDNQVSIKELASKLKVSDALLKKFIKDFDIATSRDKKLVYVTNESAEILKEIIRLRDAGKKNIEIKKLFEESQKAIAQDAASQPAAKIEETVVQVVEEAITEAPIVEAPVIQQASPEPTINISEEYFNEYLSEQVAEPETEVISLAMQQAESGSIEEHHQSRDHGRHEQQHLEEEAADEEGDDDEDERDSSGNKRRRRQFSFRFIQRQIANDLKRVNYIRHKLQRGKLSTIEKLHLEDSLAKRSSLLNGWTHLLRWVKN